MRQDQDKVSINIAKRKSRDILKNLHLNWNSKKPFLPHSMRLVRLWQERQQDKAGDRDLSKIWKLSVVLTLRLSIRIKIGGASFPVGLNAWQICWEAKEKVSKSFVQAWELALVSRSCGRDDSMTNKILKQQQSYKRETLRNGRRMLRS